MDALDPSVTLDRPTYRLHIFKNGGISELSNVLFSGNLERSSSEKLGPHISGDCASHSCRARHLHSQSQRELSTQIYYLPSPDSGRSFFCFKRIASRRLSLAHSREQQHALVAVRARRTLWLRSAASSRPIRTHPTYSTLLREMSRPNA